MATRAQTNYYNLAKQLCGQLQIPQSTLKHKTLQGTVSAPSATGNTVYAGAGPQTLEPATTDTLVWAVWQEQPRSGAGVDQTPIGREEVPHMRGQIPVINDAQAAIALQHDDWLVDPNGRRFKVLNPGLSPDGSYWFCELTRQR